MAHFFLHHYKGFIVLLLGFSAITLCLIGIQKAILRLVDVKIGKYATSYSFTTRDYTIPAVFLILASISLLSYIKSEKQTRN